MKIFCSLLLLVSLCSCYEIKRNCKDFRTGHFYSEVEINGQIYRSEFWRNDTLQVENYDDKIDSSQIRWINDCEMIFKTINPRTMATKKNVHLKILTTTDSTYTFEYSYVGESKKQKGVAFRQD